MSAQNMGWQAPAAEMVVPQQPPVYVAQPPGRKLSELCFWQLKSIKINYSCA